jgi:hypothetical protein
MQYEIDSDQANAIVTALLTLRLEWEKCAGGEDEVGRLARRELADIQSALSVFGHMSMSSRAGGGGDGPTE